MNVLRGRIKSGQVVLEHPVDWPDDTEVVVSADPPADADGPMTPAEVARVLAAMEASQPFDLTDAERASGLPARGGTPGRAGRGDSDWAG